GLVAVGEAADAALPVVARKLGAHEFLPVLANGVSEWAASLAHEKAARKGGFAVQARAQSALFDLRFFEDHVRRRDAVVLLEFEVLGLGARVLLGHVEEAGVGAGHHLDQYRGRLGHGQSSSPQANSRRARNVVAARMLSSTPRAARSVGRRLLSGSLHGVGIKRPAVQQAGRAAHTARGAAGAP